MSMQLAAPKQWQWAALIPIVAGVYGMSGHEGFAWWLLAGVPGALVLATGVMLLMMPGDPRVTSYMSLGAVIGAGLSLFLIVFHGFGAGFTALLLFAASFVTAGRVGLSNEPVYEGAAELHLDWKLAAKAATDEAVLGYFLASAVVPSGEEAARVADEAIQLEAVLNERGWPLNPDAFHRAPPPPERVQSHNAHIYGLEYERVGFDSEYLPQPELPGAQKWLTYESNARCVGNVLRHRGAPRPWIVCIHGYRMGMPWMDMSMFSPAYLHQQLGLNVLMPTLPLHGPRRIGPRTGDHFLDGDPLDLLFAESQALWDLRRWLAWLRSQEENPAIGVYGISLGGYNTALLAQYDDALDFAVAGIPLVDLASGIWRYVPQMHQRYWTSRGLDEARYREILKLVSPLARAPRVDTQHLHIFAANGDRIVAPRHPVLLSRHWKVPVNWYHGSHLSVRYESEARRVLEEAMNKAGWRAGAFVAA
jgi:hypothetical protein